MAQDSNEIWQEMMANWQAGQQSMAEQMLNSFKQWNTAFTNNKTVTNPILDTYQTIVQSFFKNFYPLNKSGLTNDWEKYLTTIPGSETVVANMKHLLHEGQQLYNKVTSEFMNTASSDESHEYLLNALADMSNPNSWLKYSGDSFDASAHKLSEGPLFSGVNDIDNRMAQVSDSWYELFEKSKAYHAIVFARWTKAYTRFIGELKSLKDQEQVDMSPRKLVDMWSSIANEELLELHRSDEFLEAQRAVIRASVQYRLDEKLVAEIICDALHIPTRDEVDDLHKTITDLRRELRQAKTEFKNTTSLADAKPKKKASTKKKPAASKTKSSSREMP